VSLFCEAHENESSYCDAKRIVQNIQDMENSWKIISKQESNNDSEFVLEYD